MARVLIVDDSPTEIFAFKRMLEEQGYEVISANNAEDGVTLAKKELPNLVLMDVVMPGMNGFQATRKIAKDPMTAHIPVIMITTKDQETDRIWAMRQGARDYVVKPPVASELLAKIRALLSEVG